MRSVMKNSITTLIVVLLTFGLFGCEIEATTSEKQEEKRTSLMDKANASVPIPDVNNFIARQSVREYMQRMDDPSKTFYIYVMGDNGNTVGYYVAKSQPMNICSFMSPTDKIEHLPGTDAVRDAPALDGVYYGDGGCNVDYWFDAETDALLQLNGLNYMISDQPLSIDADPITVEASN